MNDQILSKEVSRKDFVKKALFAVAGAVLSLKALPAFDTQAGVSVTDNSGITAISEGGTGATTAAQARTNLGFTAAGNANNPVYFVNGLPAAGNIRVSGGVMQYKNGSSWVNCKSVWG